MNEIQIQDQELIEISETEINGVKVQTVNARDLHSFLESRQDFSTWIKNRISKYDFIENQDFIKVHKKMELSATGQNVIKYAVTLDMAKELSMVERNEQGRLARRYFIECEKKLKEIKQESPKPVEPAPLPGSFRDKMEAVLMSIDRLKVKGKPKEALIVSATEKVTGIKLDYHVMIERKTYSATEIGDKFGVSANKIGRIANKHNLKVSKYDEYYIDKAKGHDKQVETFRYYDEDHVIENFLEFIEKSMTNEPQLITPASESRYDYYRKLAKGEN